MSKNSIIGKSENVLPVQIFMINIVLDMLHRWGVRLWIK